MTNPDNLFGLPDDYPTIAEQQEIAEHNKPILSALAVVVSYVHRLHGGDSAESKMVNSLFDAAADRAANFARLDARVPE